MQPQRRYDPRVRPTWVVVVIVVVAFGVDAAGAAPAVSGLAGLVLQGPTKPVCIGNDPCERPAASLLLQFSRDGKVVAEVTTTQAGRYAVRLKPGLYGVRAPGRRAGTGIRPRVVRVPQGRVAHLDLHLDTGLQ